MKAVYLLLAAFMISSSLMAQQPKAQRAEIKVPQATCEQCKQIIESVVPKYVDGLIRINVIFKRGVVQVHWYPDRTNIEELKTAIANAGFDADDVTANPDTYKKLPVCCRKPESDSPKQVAN